MLKFRHNQDSCRCFSIIFRLATLIFAALITMVRNMRILFNLLLFFAMLFAVACKTDPQLAAREGLQKIGADFTAQGFIEKVLSNDLLAAKLYLEAGIDPNTEADIVPFFKKQGVLTEDQEPVIMPALLIAQQRKYQELVELLSNFGASKTGAELAKRRVKRQLEQSPLNLTKKIVKRSPDDQEFLDSLERKLKHVDREYQLQQRKLEESLTKDK